MLLLEKNKIAKGLNFAITAEQGGISTKNWQIEI